MQHVNLYSLQIWGQLLQCDFNEESETPRSAYRKGIPDRRPLIAEAALPGGSL